MKRLKVLTNATEIVEGLSIHYDNIQLYIYSVYVCTYNPA